MSQWLSIDREDLLSGTSAKRLDELLGEPFELDEPDREAKMAKRLAWACKFGVAELSQYTDLKVPPEQPVLFQEYAVLFAFYHLERTTRGGAHKKTAEAYIETHRNLGLAHKGERLPGERKQRSGTTAQAIADETQWSHSKLHGLV